MMWLNRLSTRQRIVAGAAGAICVLLLALGGYQLARAAGTSSPATRQATSRTGTEIRVQVDGAVAKPGVYRLTSEDRMEQAIKAAGGFTKEADTTNVNLAQKLRDEQRIVVPAQKTPTMVPSPTSRPATATPAPSATPRQSSTPAATATTPPAVSSPTPAIVETATPNQTAGAPS